MWKLKQLKRVYTVLEIFENPAKCTCIHMITYTNSSWTATLTKKRVDVCPSLSLQGTHLAEKHLHLMSYYTQRNLPRSNSNTRATFSLKSHVPLPVLQLLCYREELRVDWSKWWLRTNMAAHLKAFKIYFQILFVQIKTFYRRPLGDVDSSERVKENWFMGILNNSSMHLMIYTL